MSTDQQTSSRTDPKEDQQEAGTNESAKKRLIDLSLTQVLAGALVAMTAAAIGSRLGAAGTVIGAAPASGLAAAPSRKGSHGVARTVEFRRARNCRNSQCPRRYDSPRCTNAAHGQRQT